VSGWVSERASERVSEGPKKDPVELNGDRYLHNLLGGTWPINTAFFLFPFQAVHHDMELSRSASASARSASLSLSFLFFFFHPLSEKKRRIIRPFSFLLRMRHVYVD